MKKISSVAFLPLLILIATLAACSWPTSDSVTFALVSSHENNYHSDTVKTLSLGKDVSLSANFTDEKNGVCLVSAHLTQGQIKLPIPFVALPTAAEDAKNLAGSFVQNDLVSLGFVEGEAELQIEAQNCSLFKGKTIVTQKTAIDLTPPRVALTSSQHYINQAGADVALYTVSDDAVWSGVKIDKYDFKGYPNPKADAPKGEHFAFFVYPYHLDSGAKIEIVAKDAAGNVGKATLTPSKFFPKEFRKRDIAIDDDFITTKIADIIANTPSVKNTGDNLQNFLSVNRDLRLVNNQFLVELAKQSEEKFYWKDAFRPLVNASIEASFADYRTYTYNNEKVDEQVHLGFDMAVVERHPILSGAAGKVAFAGYLGIYGNTVVVDHGYGLMTLYAHMSAMDVAAGDIVAKDQKLGNSGATGLAGGDHLHFSMLIQGVQVNPIEFWDQHWIEDHVYLRLGNQMFGQLE